MAVLVGKKAPDFNVKATINGNQIVDSYTLSQLNGQYVLLFFYPKDFTFVCPTELHAFQSKLADFQEKNVQVLGCSVDSEFSHFAWQQTEKGKGGIEGVTYPLLADFNKTIARDYDVLDEMSGASYRGLFIIDKEGVVRHQLVNDMPLGRNVDEALRMVDALQYFEKNGEVCPANWKQGEEAINTTHKSVGDYLAKQN